MSEDVGKRNKAILQERENEKKRKEEKEIQDSKNRKAAKALEMFFLQAVNIIKPHHGCEVTSFLPEPEDYIVMVQDMVDDMLKIANGNIYTKDIERILNENREGVFENIKEYSRFSGGFGSDDFGKFVSWYSETSNMFGDKTR